MRKVGLAIALLTAACAPITGAATPPVPVLLPYSTTTPLAAPELPAGSVVSAETPLPSSTPSSYTIRSGDTLSQIAERLRVSVDSLLSANPALDPNALRVGETLLVPGGASTALATPTPAPVKILDVDCRPMTTGAAWCFALIHNDSTEAMESVTGVISIMDSSGAILASQDVALLLDILPPGASLPLAAPFQGPLPLDLQPQVRILTGLRLPADTPRYVPASVRNVITQVSWSGRAAEVIGDVHLQPGSADAAEVWLSALAYDESGKLVGWRRWESSVGARADAALPFQLWVYSLAGAIDRVDLVVQARP